MIDDTIAQIATPPGEGGIHIIRISGAHAISCASKYFSKDIASLNNYSINYGTFKDEQGHFIDEVLLLLMLGPKTFTGEDVVEIHCHGGKLIAQTILHLLLNTGARAATAGEFTKRAYLNGKIDLTKAEAIQQMISAQNQRAQKAAAKHLEGKLEKIVHTLQNTLLEALSLIEAYIDYPDEDLEPTDKKSIIEKIECSQTTIDTLLKSYREGTIIDQGITIALVGKPNVGKSSLLNAMLDKNKAIVTPIAGTTRDLVEESMLLDGVHTKFIDTAGIRASSDAIEQAGIEKSQTMIQQADIILHISDINLPLDEDPLYKLLPTEKTLFVRNKLDTLPQAQDPLSISAKEKIGLDKLKDAIIKKMHLKSESIDDELHISSERHFFHLKAAANNLKKVLDGIEEKIAVELLSIDLRDALQSLSEIIGINITEEVLSKIFANFCVGK